MAKASRASVAIAWLNPSMFAPPARGFRKLAADIAIGPGAITPRGTANFESHLAAKR